jgi:hypothetical protein
MFEKKRLHISSNVFMYMYCVYVPVNPLLQHSQKRLVGFFKQVYVHLSGFLVALLQCDPM